MYKPLFVALCACALFVGGWAAGSARSQYQHNAANWKVLTDFEKVLFVHGFHQGYSAATDMREVLARQDLSASQRAVVEQMDREMTGSGLNRHITAGQLATAMSSFYGDFRNQPVCWGPALTFSIKALNGTAPTEQELNRVREGAAKSGCE